ncbi:uncharacterized protein PG986_002436 [Apiospora aurea]|uniref:Uncharacterized protein n=1 Tax=Apiospora aurea TaxID=335848 RepID=A0ABR1QNU0_9PEZI
MPSNNDLGYSYKSSGTNSQLIMTYQGNHYCSRDYGSSAANSNSYHYSNTNHNGSTYHQSSSGTSTYTTPSGYIYRSSGGSSSSGKK